jgi:hypothetical protein
MDGAPVGAPPPFLLGGTWKGLLGNSVAKLGRADAPRERDCLFTSPRWGEVAPKARVRRFGRWSFSRTSEPPHPTLSPLGRGSTKRRAKNFYQQMESPHSWAQRNKNRPAGSRRTSAAPGINAKRARSRRRRRKRGKTALGSGCGALARPGIAGACAAAPPTIRRRAWSSAGQTSRPKRRRMHRPQPRTRRPALRCRRKRRRLRSRPRSPAL